MTNRSTMPADVRQALQDLMVEYCYAVDDLNDVQPLLDLFTDDAVADLTAIGLPLMDGKGAIKAFFDGVFADMTHHFHYISNFRPAGWDGTVAAMTAYVVGMGRASDGNTVEVQVQYLMECVQGGGRWRCRRYVITPKMPMPGSLAEIHADR